jgi:CxxC motif-containing protein (DUF1111 family)
MKSKSQLVYGLVVALLLSCEDFPAAPNADQILDGPIEGLTSTEQALFLKGDAAFNDEIFTVAKGLGPLFVANSCGGCHAGDGKGHPFTTLTRFGQSSPSGNDYLHLGAPQLQNRAVPGHQPETIPSGATFSKFTPPANTGLGYLDAVTDADILSMADPDDLDGDGISGVPNWVTMKNYLTARTGHIEKNGKYIGRFGKKGSTYDLTQQTAQAYNQDMGISSSYERYDTFSGLEMDPEVSYETVASIVFYLKTLKAPIQRDEENAEIIAGKNIFAQIQCATCHRPELKTGHSPVAVLANKTFYPYTDLLLHDMGPALDDKYTEGSAQTYEWKTPALWGLGLSKNSQGGNYFLLHDGRASSIEEAIIQHGGEAENSKKGFQALTENQKSQLILFLESL